MSSVIGYCCVHAWLLSLSPYFLHDYLNQKVIFVHVQEPLLKLYLVSIVNFDTNTTRN